MTKLAALVLAVLLLLPTPAASAASSPAASAASVLGREAEAVAAGQAVPEVACRSGLAASAPPVGIGSCPGVRPGAQVQIGSSRGPLCTLNFAFTGRLPDGTKARYIGTAGHCVLGEGALGQFGGGERRWAAGSGPVALRADGKRIGRVAYAVLRGDYDFALIRVARGVSMSAQMCTFGGPTGLRTDRPSQTVRLQYHGQGLVLGNTVPGRQAVAFGMPHRTHVSAVGAAISGDSGSAVVSADGRAVGVLNAIGVFADSPSASGASDSGVISISRLGPLVARAERFTNTGLTLRRAAQL